MMRPGDRLALYMEGAFEEKTGKLGLGVLRYSSHPIVAMVDTANAGHDSLELTGIDRDCPVVSTIAEARELDADTLVLGIAPPGGLVPPSWWPHLDEAVATGMNLVNGLHEKMAPRYPNLAPGQYVWDVRTEPTDIGVGTAAARCLPNRRVLMIGTDMSVGKMTAGLELTASARAARATASFVATGQTGIVITGQGVPLDAIRLDYASGAIEAEVMRCAESDLIVIEGQGSLIHPGSSANLPLLRGSCPTHMVLCHRAGMASLPRLPWVTVPDLRRLAGLYEDLSEACGVFPRAKVCAIALNTGHLSQSEADDAVEEVTRSTGWPCCDPVRHGAATLFEAVMA